MLEGVIWKEQLLKERLQNRCCLYNVHTYLLLRQVFTESVDVHMKLGLVGSVIASQVQVKGLVVVPKFVTHS